MIGAAARGPSVVGFFLAASVLAAAMIAQTGGGFGQTAGEGQRFDLRIENGRLADDLKVIRVRRGDMVELNWSADRRTALHLHGYDIEITVDAGRPQTMSFTARATGRFPIEKHSDAGRHAVLLYL